MRLQAREDGGPVSNHAIYVFWYTVAMKMTDKPKKMALCSIMVGLSLTSFTLSAASPAIADVSGTSAGSTPQTATGPLLSGENVLGSLATPDTVQYYKVTIRAGSRIVIDLTDSSAATTGACSSVNATLLDAAGNVPRAFSASLNLAAPGTEAVAGTAVSTTQDLLVKIAGNPTEACTPSTGEATYSLRVYGDLSQLPAKQEIAVERCQAAREADDVAQARFREAEYGNSSSHGQSKRLRSIAAAARRADRVLLSSCPASD